MIPTRAPVPASASARFAVTVDFPTPPLPLATGTMFLIVGVSACFRSPPEARTRDVIATSTARTPGSAATA